MLALNEPRRPKQSSLRRSVSASYYAVFHLLMDDACQLMTPSDPAGLRTMMRRAFSHTDMKSVCEKFKSSNPPSKLAALLSPALAGEPVFVARAFVDLQGARHKADYDFSMELDRAEALSHWRKADEAFEAWAVARRSADARVFLTALLLNDRWHK